MEETFALGKKFAENLGGVQIVLLYGELGAGKTEFVRGVCSGFGFEGRVLSPTFQLVRVYEIKVKRQKAKGKSGNRVRRVRRIFHVDLYRLENNVGFEGIKEYFEDEEGVTLVEWVERLPKEQLPPKFWQVKIIFLSENERQFDILGI